MRPKETPNPLDPPGFAAFPQLVANALLLGASLIRILRIRLAEHMTRIKSKAQSGPNYVARVANPRWNEVPLKMQVREESQELISKPRKSENRASKRQSQTSNPAQSHARAE